jgi:hypothetical protein
MDSMAQVQRTENFELAYRKALGSRTFTASAYHESVSNAAFLMAAPGGYYSSADLLPDLSTDGSIFNMGRYRRTGLMASVTQKVGGDLSVALAGGNAGVLTPGIRSLTTDDPNELRGLMGSGRRNWVAARITGLAPLTGTRFSAAYQWSDYRTISPTHLYLTQGFQPALGLNLQLRQPLPTFGIWSGRIEASAELRNLLAQGYVPVSTYDGRTLYFLQNPRAVRGGLSFIF